MIKRIFFNATFLFLSIQVVHAQVAKSSILFIELKKQDSIFFERGFNQCDMEYLDKTISTDLKFYHDQSGFQDKSIFMDNTRKYICGNSDKKPIRKLEEGSLTVYPLHNNGKLYGAIQHGVHHFHIIENGKEDVWTGTAKFTSVWLKENATWKLSEVLSYDHHEPTTASGQTNSIEKLLIENNVPALGMGVIKNGKLSTIKIYGTLDTQTTAPYNTIFKVASLTKPIVALTTLKLIDNGLLDLDEPLYKYWIDPDIKNDDRAQKLTARLVLTHQTGFPNWRYMTDTKKLSFEFEPGTKHQYSGEGFEYLRNAIENKLGKPIELIANELVFEPAQMTDTRFWWDETMDESRYAQNFDSSGENIPTEKYFAANAAANLLTTVEDYGNFLTYLINGAELSKELYNEMIAPQIKIRENNYFGLGWEIFSGFSGGEFALLHSGRDPGVSTLAVIFPKSKNGYLLFFNGDNSMPLYEELLTKQLYLGNEIWNRR